MNKVKSKSLISFKKPPVIEVVCGVVFEPILGFKAHHLGLFWQRVRNEFPECEHAVRLGFDPAAAPIDLANYLPRVWFINEEQNRLIQLQDDIFFFNWRRMKEDEAYPRYSTIIEDFKVNFKVFQEFLKEQDLPSVKPKACELTYINHILKGEGWESLRDINGVFRDIAWDSMNKRFLPEPQHISGQIVFPLPDDKGNLVLKLEHGRRKPDQHPIIILHNSARGLGRGRSIEDIWEWFAIAHEWIVQGFADISTPTIQKEVWQRRDID
ncbi:MAG: TIGR04255 family protein [Deltaproteobacteria bacterium]|nr:TIGR04255 family protein [Deltaproteobacteria bacterium]